VKKYIIITVKLSASLAILGYLFWLFWSKSREPGGAMAFDDLLHKPKRWDLLAASWIAAVGAVLLTLIRWCYLVRALKVPLSMRDAMRIGWIGNLFNLSPLGIVGGDLIKAVMLAHERPGNRVKAAASVVVDRIIGLYVLFLVAMAGIFVTGFWGMQDELIHGVCVAVLAITVVSTVGLAIVLWPGVLESRWVTALERVPRVGPVVGHLLEALRMYRGNVAVLLGTSVITLGVHSLLAVSLWLAAEGLNFTGLGLVSFFTIYPISSIASTIPLPAGPFEYTVAIIYAAALTVPGGAPAGRHLGTIGGTGGRGRAGRRFSLGLPNLDDFDRPDRVSLLLGGPPRGVRGDARGRGRG
jgi:hypothetical protein